MVDRHPSLPGVYLPDLSARVRRRLRAVGHDRPGYCMTAAVVGCAELSKSGFRVFFQAGSASWKRLSDERAAELGEQGTQAFSYVYDPDHPVSRAGLAAGDMPEFHAWCVVVPADLPANGYAEDARSVVVDFAAHHLPAVCVAAGKRWESPHPGEVYVAGWGDMVDPVTNRMAACDYTPKAEATLLAAAVLQNRACEAIIDGVVPAAHVADWMPFIGGDPVAATLGDPAAMKRLRDNAAAIRGMRPADALRALRRHRARQPSRPAAGAVS